MNKRYLGWLITGLVVALFFIGQARAQTILHWDANGNIIGSTSQAQLNELQRIMNNYNGRSAPMPSSASINGGLVSLERAATLEVGAGSGLGSAVKVAVVDVVKSPVASLGRGVLAVARTSPAGLAGTVAASILLDAGIRYINGQWMKDGAPMQAPNGVPYPASEYAGAGLINGATVFGDAATVCKAVIQDAIANNVGVVTTYAGISTYSSTYGCRRTRVDNGVTYESPLQRYTQGVCYQSGASKDNSTGMCVPPGYVPATGSAPATDAQIEGAMTSGISFYPNKVNDVLKNIYDNGGWVPLDVADAAGWTIATPTVNGKPSTATTNSTAPNGDSITTTKTTTPTLNVGQTGGTAGTNTLTYTITNNTTTTVTNNTTGQTQTSTDEEDPPITFEDKAMPDVPKLYTQKYPDGMGGVWRDNKPDVQSTPFFQGVKSMFPSFGGGSCPVWSLSFNLGAAGNFGSRQFDVPCWIFQAVGLMMLVTATFTARKIIF